MSDIHISLENLEIPSDREDSIRKLELFIILSKRQESLQYWNQLEQSFSDADRLDLTLYEEVHYRLTALALHRARLPLATLILRGVPEPFQLETHTALASLLGHYSDAAYDKCVFPLNVEHKTRFEGPHLHAREGVCRWLAGRISSVEVDQVDVSFVDPVAAQGPTYTTMTIPKATLSLWSSEVPEDLEVGDFFEVVVYGSEETLPVIRFWDRSWDGWSEIPDLRIDPVRYLRASGLILNGQTFVEQALRGEATLSQVDDFVDEWHNGSSSWGLADYLGMLPEEYIAWVRDPASLSTLLKSRRELQDPAR